MCECMCNLVYCILSSPDTNFHARTVIKVKRCPYYRAVQGVSLDRCRRLSNFAFNPLFSEHQKQQETVKGKKYFPEVSEKWWDQPLDKQLVQKFPMNFNKSNHESFGGVCQQRCHIARETQPCTPEILSPKKKELPPGGGIQTHGTLQPRQSIYSTN